MTIKTRPPVKFEVPLDGSVSFCWAGQWYTTSYAHSRALERMYRSAGGAHPHGPTHEDKLALARGAGWEHCAVGAVIHMRPPAWLKE